MRGFTLDPVEGLLLESIEMKATEGCPVVFSNVLSRLGKKAGRPKARVINSISDLGTDYLDHCPDDVALRVEFARIAGRVRSHILQQPLIEFRKHDNIGRVTKVETI